MSNPIETSTVDELRKILLYISKGYKVPNIIYDTIFKVAVEEIEKKDKMVLIKRDPNIERNRIQSTRVKIIDGETIELHPAIVKGFGADFDGDQMAVFAPISKEAQEESKKLLSAVTASSINSPQFDLGKEAITGLFTLTFEEDLKSKIISIKDTDDLDRYNISQMVNYKGIKTTIGRVIFNKALPDNYPFINEPINKKKLNKLFEDLISKNRREYVTSLDKLTKIGFKYATLYPKSISLDMLTIPKELYKLKEKLGKEKDLVRQAEILNQMDEYLLEHFKNNVPDLYQQITSGAAKGKDQIRQVMVAKGLIRDGKGEILPPISRSMNEGYSPKEYFDASAGARAGLISRTHFTSKGGYLYRQGVYSIGNVVANVNVGNCGTRRTLNIKLTEQLMKRMRGRYVQDDKGNIKPVTPDMVGQIINLRSPIYCKTKGICRTCYGDLIKQLNSKSVGIIAAMECLSLSEKIMKCSSGLIIKDGKVYSMEDVWKEFGCSKTTVEDSKCENLKVETRDLNINILGKDRYVKAFKIQRHKPSSNMALIVTDTEHFIVTQVNHPLFIKRNDKIEELEVWDLRVGDKIWVDNTIALNNNSIIPSKEPDFVFNNIIKYFKTGDINDINTCGGMICADNCKTLRFEPNFINYDYEWVYEFLECFIEQNKKELIEIPSFNFIQQLRMLCDKVGFDFKLIYDSLDYNILYNQPVMFKCFIEKNDNVTSPIKEYRYITSVKYIYEWDDCVYDIKTDTKEFLNAFIQNHNSFHTGGAVEFRIPDIKSEIMRFISEEYKKTVDKFFRQEENSLYSENDLTVVIPLKIFEKKYRIIRKSNLISLPLGYFIFKLGDVDIPVNIEMQTDFYLNDVELEETDENIIIKYKRNSLILKVKIKEIEAYKTAQLLGETLSGNSPWTSVESLYYKLFSLLSDLSDFDSIHLEIIVGNILRAKRDPQLPARLKEPFDPTIVSFKSLPGTMSWVLGLAFENWVASLTRGLISTRPPETDIEKVMFGATISPLAEDSKK